MSKKDNNKSDSKQEQKKSEFKCNEEQYKLLLSCSKKKNIMEWNQYRHDKEIWLQDANLEGAYLCGVDFQGAPFLVTHLQGANFRGANLQNANLVGASLQGADFQGAHLQGAIFRGANLQSAYLVGARLKGADFGGANLQGVNLSFANLQDVSLWGVNLQGAELISTNLRGANFQTTIVDGRTRIWECKVDKETDFTGVGLNNARIEPELKQLLEYNIRRIAWKAWYRGKTKNIVMTNIHQLVTSPIRAFWWISNYGLSTWRILATFFGLAIIFAGIYSFCGLVQPPGVVSGLFEGREGIVPNWLVPFRTIYFSIVTMTTLGFGDMHTNCQSFWGHLLLTIQVILGYVLLGALVTRFAVLFTAGGPAGSFTSIDKETKELLKKKLKEDKEKVR